MIDQAGFLAATKYCNQGRGSSSTSSSSANSVLSVFSSSRASTPLVAALVRMEQCDFHEAMHIGEVAQVHAEVTFVARHSLEVLVEVTALNPLTGVTRHTNTARAWYVAMPLPEKGKSGEPSILPPMLYPSEEAEKDGMERYLRQKNLRQNDKEIDEVVQDCSRVRRNIMQLHLHPDDRKRHTVADSASSLVQLMLPSDCTSNGVVQAGTSMKLMVGTRRRRMA